MTKERPKKNIYLILYYNNLENLVTHLPQTKTNLVTHEPYYNSILKNLVTKDPYFYF